MSTLRRICLVGVRGVGKTTLVRSVLGELPHVDYVLGSAVLRELAGADFARFDHLAPAIKEQYRRDAIRWMEERQARVGKPILCDGHTSLLDESTGAIGCVFTERDCAFFRELILLEAPVEVVLSQRRGDTSKLRSLETDVIRAELEGERESASRLAAEWSLTLHRLPPATDPSTPARLKELLAP
jgi:adenylate kinase